MPYVRVWIHMVWATKERKPLLERGVRTRVFEHLKQNAKEKDIYVDKVGGYLEHVHLLVSLGADQTISKIMQLLKGESSHWINQNSLVQSKFEWQDEYCAVSVGESDLEAIRRYIDQQEEHHRTKSFAEEFEEFLKSNGARDVGLKSL